MSKIIEMDFGKGMEHIKSITLGDKIIVNSGYTCGKCETETMILNKDSTKV